MWCCLKTDDIGIYNDIHQYNLSIFPISWAGRNTKQETYIGGKQCAHNKPVSFFNPPNYDVSRLPMAFNGFNFEAIVMTPRPHGWQEWKCWREYRENVSSFFAGRRQTLVWRLMGCYQPAGRWFFVAGYPRLAVHSGRQNGCLFVEPHRFGWSQSWDLVLVTQWISHRTCV